MAQGTPTQYSRSYSPSEETLGSHQSARTGDFAPDHIIRASEGRSQAHGAVSQDSPPSLSTTLVSDSSESSRSPVPYVPVPLVVGSPPSERFQPSLGLDEEQVQEEEEDDDEVEVRPAHGPGYDFSASYEAEFPELVAHWREKDPVNQQRRLEEAEEALDESSHPVAEGFWGGLSRSISDIPGFHDDSQHASRDISVYRLAQRRNHSSQHSLATGISRPSDSHSLAIPVQVSGARSDRDQQPASSEASTQAPRTPRMSLLTSFNASPKSTLAAPRSQSTSVRGTLSTGVSTSTLDVGRASPTRSGLERTTSASDASHADNSGSD